MTTGGSRILFLLTRTKGTASLGAGRSAFAPAVISFNRLDVHLNTWVCRSTCQTISRRDFHGVSPLCTESRKALIYFYSDLKVKIVSPLSLTTYGPNTPYFFKLEILSLCIRNGNKMHAINSDSFFLDYCDNIYCSVRQLAEGLLVGLGL